MTPLGSEKDESGEEGGVLIYDCLFLALGAFFVLAEIQWGRRPRWPRSEIGEMID